MRIQRLILALVLALSFTVGTVPLMRERIKGSGHATKGASKPKTVHVKEYTRKDARRSRRMIARRRSPRGQPRESGNGQGDEARTDAAIVSAARDENGRIKRSASARHAFEVQTGFPHGRPGYVIDHIRPLACGGADDPFNMQWQMVEAAKAKDRVERIGC